MEQEDKFIVPHLKPAVGKSTVLLVCFQTRCSPNLRMLPHKRAVPAMN